MRVYPAMSTAEQRLVLTVFLCSLLALDVNLGEMHYTHVHVVATTPLRYPLVRHQARFNSFSLSLIESPNVYQVINNKSFGHSDKQFIPDENSHAQNKFSCTMTPATPLLSTAISGKITCPYTIYIRYGIRFKH